MPGNSSTRALRRLQRRRCWPLCQIFTSNALFNLLTVYAQCHFGKYLCTNRVVLRRLQVLVRNDRHLTPATDILVGLGSRPSLLEPAADLESKTLLTPPGLKHEVLSVVQEYRKLPKPEALNASTQNPKPYTVCPETQTLNPINLYRNPKLVDFLEPLY